MRAKRFLIFISFLAVVTFLSPFSQSFAEEKKSYTLEELLSIAIKNNPSVAIFRANLEASRGEVLSARAYPNPEIDLEGGKGKSRETSDSAGEYSIGIGQTLEWPWKRMYRRKAAEAGVGVIEKEVEDFRLQLRSEVKKVFYQILLDKKAVEITRENLKIVDELLKSVEVRVKAGETPEFELVKARVELLKADKDLKKAENRIFISRASLDALLGGVLKDDFDVEGAFTLPEKRYDLDAVLSYALDKHPLILRAKREIEARDYILERERQSLFPDITVKGLYGKEIDKEAYNIGLSIPVPLWYQRKGEIATAAAEKARAESEMLLAKAELSRAITEEFQNYLIALDQIDVFEKGLLKQAEEALRIADLSYRQGESGILDFLDAQRVYRSTLMEYYESLFAIETSLAGLERMAGGLEATQ